MDTLKIYVSRQLDGFNFALMLSTRREITKKYPTANPIGLIYIATDTKEDFEEIYGRIENHLLPLLTGLDVKELQIFVLKIQFIDTVTNNLLYEYTLKNVEEKQPLPG